MNFSLENDEQAILGALTSSVLGRAPIDSIEYLSTMSDDVLNASVTSRWDALIEEGWAALPQEGVSVACLAECIATVNTRIVPDPLPLLEIWLASVVTSALTGGAKINSLNSKGRYLLGAEAILSPRTSDGDYFSAGVNLSYGDVEGVFTLVQSETGRVDVLLLANTERRIDFAGPSVDIVSERAFVRTPRDTWVSLGSIGSEDFRKLQFLSLCLVGAALSGIASEVLQVTLQYLKDREQFGKPIGAFQALKHRMVDTHADVHVARLVVMAASSSVPVDEQALNLGLMAKAMSGTTTMAAIRESIQMHGGVGYTWDSGLHVALRRAVELTTGGVSTSECFSLLGKWATQQDIVPWAADLSRSVGVNGV